MPDQTQPTWPVLAAEAEELVRAASAEGIAIRVVGSTGIHLHCAPAAAAIERAERACKDIDFIVRGGDRKPLRALLEARGYEVDRDILVAGEGTRFTFVYPGSEISLDVFVDRMEFSHTIDLSKRLEMHGRTIPVEDLLPQKLQVHDFTRNDLLDAIALLSTHSLQIAAEDHEQIDVGYVAGLLARDWGFHRTALENLARIEQQLEEGDETVTADPGEARERAAALREAIDSEPKSRGWRLRARVGDRIQWWNDVDDPRGAY